jgi:hypothetical protein
MSKIFVIINWGGLIAAFLLAVLNGKERNIMGCFMGLTLIVYFTVKLTQYTLTTFEDASIGAAFLIFSIGGVMHKRKRIHMLSKSNEALPQTDKRYSDET